MSIRIPYLRLFIVLMMIAAGPTLAASEGGKEPSLKDYKALWERNIFSRNRETARRREPDEEREKERKAPSPEQSYVLSGVMQRGAQYCAFFEDLQTGSTLRVDVGDEIARGSLKEITLDSVSYARGEDVIEVNIGRTLEGNAPRQGLDYSGFQDYLGGGPVPETGGEEPASEEKKEGQKAESGQEGQEDPSAILERLKQRRQKELNK